jgi:hypothetical protein
MGTVATVAAVLASAGALVAIRGSEPPSTPLPSPTLTEAPGVPEKASDLVLTGAADGGQAGDSASATTVPTEAAQIEPPPAEPSPTPLPTATPSTPETPDPVASSWSATPEPLAPDPVASSSSATPEPVPQAPVPTPQPVADRLVQEAAQRFGIQIVLDGQDWGEGEAAQTTNIGAVIGAMEQLPQSVVSAVTAHAYGPLTFVSNRQGRTLAGWQPYGNFPMGFYTNSDRGSAGSVPANQVVLIPGFAEMSIGHEILHAYQFRNVGPDQYVLALLGDEMRSFMAAAGWRQVGTDEQVRAAANQPWDVVNSLYVYEGRPLTYTTVGGSTVTLSPPNPLEAFAVAGSVYYTRPSGTPLPDWPEYWDWFQANLG